MSERELLERERRLISADEQAAISERGRAALGSAERPGKPGKVVLIMTVEIGDGRSGTVTVRRGDSAEALAEAFATEHALDAAVIAPLREHIEGNVRAAEMRRAERRTPKPSSSSARPPRPRSASAKPSAPEVKIARRPGTAKASRRRSSDQSKPKVGSSHPRLQKLAQDYPRQREERLERLRTRAEAEFAQSHRATPAIDPNSRRIAQKMHGARGPDVFARLYARAGQAEAARDQRGAVLAAEELSAATAGASGMSSGSRALTNGSGTGSGSGTGGGGGGSRMSRVSQRLARDRGVGGAYANYGERLYAEGKRARERKEAAAARARKEREMEEEKELTFKPKISGRRGSTGERERTVPPHAASDALLELRERDRERLAAELRMQEMSECTFHPRISEASRRIVARMREMDAPDGGNDGGDGGGGGDTVPRHELLYRDAEQRRLRQADYACWVPETHTFRPSLPQASATRYDVDEADFIDRLVYSKQKKEALVAQLRADAERRGVDPDTGETLFRPRTGRGPITGGATTPTADAPPGAATATATDTHKGSALHAQARERDARLARERAERAAELESAAAQPRGSEASRRIMHRTLRRRLAQIFARLDDDGDGYVEPATARGTALPIEVARDVMPLLARFDERFVSRDRFVKGVFAELVRSRTGPRPHFFSSRAAREAEEGDAANAGTGTGNSTGTGAGTGAGNSTGNGTGYGTGTGTGYGTGTGSGNVSDPEATFHPKINDRSEKLAEKRRRSVRRELAGLSRMLGPEGQDLEDMGVDDEGPVPDMPVHEVLLREAEVWAHRKATLFEERVSAELRECTFQPNTGSGSGSGSGTGANTGSGSGSGSGINSGSGSGRVAEADLVRRLSQRSLRSGHGAQKALTTEEIELREHCTFRPGVAK